MQQVKDGLPPLPIMISESFIDQAKTNVEADTLS